MVFAVSAALCLVLTPVAMAVAIRTGVLDRPGGHKSHLSSVPYLGGVAIVVAFSCSVIGAAIIDPPETGSNTIIKFTIKNSYQTRRNLLIFFIS